MTITLGAHHTCSSPTLFSIAKPLGLVIHLTGIPNYVPRDVFSPTEYHGLGRINLGNSLGFLEHHALVAVNQLVYPIADDLDLLRVSAVPGITVDIDEIVRPGVLPSSLMPWDRNPTPVLAQSQQFVTSAAAGLWAYTVPAGKKLLLQHAEIVATPAINSTAVTRINVAMTRSTSAILTINNYTVIANYNLRDTLALSDMVLLAGEALSAQYDIVQTGGVVSVFSYASGLLFDA